MEVDRPRTMLPSNPPTFLFTLHQQNIAGTQCVLHTYPMNLIFISFTCNFLKQTDCSGCRLCISTSWNSLSPPLTPRFTPAFQQNTTRLEHRTRSFSSSKFRCNEIHYLCLPSLRSARWASILLALPLQSFRSPAQTFPSLCHFPSLIMYIAAPFRAVVWHSLPPLFHYPFRLRKFSSPCPLTSPR